jgi:hypothetical protein
MRVRQLDDVDQTDIALTALDSADVVSVEVRQLRQLFLRKTAVCPELGHVFQTTRAGLALRPPTLERNYASKMCADPAFWRLLSQPERASM